MGGIIGYGYPKVTNSSVCGDETSEISDGRQVGGIIGFGGEGTAIRAENCTVENITISGTRCIGGIIGWAHYGNGVKDCTVRNVKINTTTGEQGVNGFITGTTNSEDCGNGYMEFYGNTVENSSLYSQNVLVSQEVSMETMFASYGLGVYYATDDNGNYVFFAQADAANSYVATHPTMTVKTTNFNAELTLLNDGDTYTLSEDMTLPRIEWTTNRTITIDLAGHTITDTGADAFLVKSGKLIVIDSVGGGTINHTGKDDLVWLQNGGTLQLVGGTFNFATKYGIAYGGENVVINGGTFNFEAGTDNANLEEFKGYVSLGKNVTINGDSFTKA